MGILNRTPDSFYDKGATFSLDALLDRADRLVTDGADILDVGGVKAGPGPDVSEAEELDRVIPAIEALHDRVDVPLSVDTWRASVAGAAYAAGAVLGNDISGFADPDYLPVAAGGGRDGGGHPHPDRTSRPRPRARLRRRGGVGARLSRRAGRPGARRRVWTAIRSCSTPGSTSARPPAQSLELLRASGVLAQLGLPRAPVGLEQAVPRRHARSRHRPSPRRVARGRLPSASHSAAASCGSMTSLGTRRVCDALAAVLEAA